MHRLASVRPQTDRSLGASNGCASKPDAALKYSKRQCLSRLPNFCFRERNPSMGLINFNFLIAFILGIILPHFELLMISGCCDLQIMVEHEALC